MSGPFARCNPAASALLLESTSRNERVVMQTGSINRLSGRALVLLSVTALLLVLYGYTLPPQADEGTPAHLFQLLIVLLVPTGLAFLATADWSQPARAARPLALSATALVLAFAALYALEHYFYR
jgi:hypothetical protein